MIFSSSPSRRPYTFALGWASSSWYFMIFSIVCQGRGWAQRLNKEQGASAHGEVSESQGGSQCPFPRFSYKYCCRDLSHVGDCVLFLLYGSSLFLGDHRLRAPHHGRFQICSDLGMRSAELLGSGTSAELSLRLAWCLCRPTPSHNYLPHPVSPVVWSCNK